MFKKIWYRFSSSEFSKNVSTQIFGTGLAQALPFLATPILTRLFSEADFALYTSFFAVASIFAVAVGGKYQMAIVLPKEKNDASNIFTLSIYITIGYSLSIAILFFLFFEYLFTDLGDLLYYVPIYVLFFGVWSSFTNLSIRHKTFAHNAIAKVLQSIGYIFIAIGLGLSRFALYGLVLAKILGTLISWLFLFKKSLVKLQLIGIKELGYVAKKYIDYPKYGVFPAFLNTVSSQALILVLTKFYTTDDLGHFGLTYMVLSAPLGLIGTSYKDVFFQKIATQINEEKFTGALNFFKKSAWALFFMGLPIGLVLYFFGENIFSLVFGEKWGRSGEFAAILAFSFMIKLVVSPLSSIFNATNRLKTSSLWQTFYFITTFLTLGLSSYTFECTVDELLYIYVIHELILYSLYFLLEYRTLWKFTGHVRT
ncbi:lipopolysaccharide biosynthesis protein [Pseudozobellia sp. WGM2]|uniref:lipopolysaccharide biosynthesis protein n=1 Tax=Pseudozobellia sp. WGM2 TaxID=2787625 RepID=UPI001ADF0D60|nr:oligosaccharide flippase family protein [Pseudozobellia sp. WGM2]